MARVVLVCAATAALVACDRGSRTQVPPELPDEPSPVFRNVSAQTDYVGDATCESCHRAEAAAYAQHAMSRSFHRCTSIRWSSFSGLAEGASMSCADEWIT
jgi:hypothetical protein